MYSEAATRKLGPEICPLCRSNCFRQKDARESKSFYVCPTCGKFIISDWTADRLLALDDRGRKGTYKISFQLRKISEGALGKKDNSLFPVHSLETLEKWRTEPDISVQEKLNLLLRFLGSTALYPGQEQEIDLANDYTLVCARNYKEYKFYLESLAEQLLIVHKPKVGPNVVIYALAASGWHELDMLNRAGSESSNAFIAMSFDSSRNLFSTAISSAIELAGYKPVRVDRVEHVNRIDDEIISQIRGSKFLVSDFTGQRNGVYFEAGFMLGLGRPVIWICDEQEIDKVHFDTRQYNTIFYTDADDLRRRLQFRIEAILGKGNHKPG